MNIAREVEYREGHLKIVKEVGGLTEKVAEAGLNNIHGNFYDPFVNSESN